MTDTRRTFLAKVSCATAALAAVRGLQAEAEAARIEAATNVDPRDTPMCKCLLHEKYNRSWISGSAIQTFGAGCISVHDYCWAAYKAEFDSYIIGIYECQENNEHALLLGLSKPDSRVTSRYFYWHVTDFESRIFARAHISYKDGQEVDRGFTFVPEAELDSNFP